MARPLPVIVFNTTGEAIPGGAWMEAVGTKDSLGRVNVRKATRGGLAGYVNGLTDIPPGQGGGGYSPYGDGVRLAVHPDDTITAADTIGPKAGEWLARLGQAGFRRTGPVFAGFLPVVAEGGSGIATAGPQFVVRPTAAGAGDGTYATGVVQVQSGDGWADGTETVWFKPRTLGQKQKVGPLWWSCWDTGLVDTGFTPARRKIIGVDPPKIKRRNLVLCDGGTPQYVDVWMDDVD